MIFDWGGLSELESIQRLAQGLFMLISMIKVTLSWNNTLLNTAYFVYFMLKWNMVKLFYLEEEKIGYFSWQIILGFLVK